MQITGNLVYVKASSAVETEVSRVVPLQQQTRYAYNVLVTSTNLGLASIDLALQYSNDLDNWTTVSGSTLNVSTFPANVSVNNSDAADPSLPGEFVRLRYTFNGSTGASAAIQASISLKSN